MNKRTRMISLFALILLVGCDRTTSSDQEVSVASDESTVQTSSESLPVASDTEVIFADEDMELYVRKLIGKEEGTITAIDVEAVDALNLGNKEISAIDGIKYFTNLRILYLNDSEVSGLDELSGLLQLEYLQVVVLMQLVSFVFLPLYVLYIYKIWMCCLRLTKFHLTYSNEKEPLDKQKDNQRLDFKPTKKHTPTK